VFVWPLLLWLLRSLFESVIPRMAQRGLSRGGNRGRAGVFLGEDLNLLLPPMPPLIPVSGALCRGFHSTGEACAYPFPAAPFQTSRCPSCRSPRRPNPPRCAGFGMPRPGLLTTINALTARTGGFSLGAVLRSLVSLHPPLQKEILFNYLFLCKSLLFLCTFLTSS